MKCLHFKAYSFEWTGDARDILKKVIEEPTKCMEKKCPAYTVMKCESEKGKVIKRCDRTQLCSIESPATPAEEAIAEGMFKRT